MAFLNDKNPAASGWTLAHEMGRLHVQRVFGGQITATAYHDVLSGEPMQAVEQAIADGNTVLFTTSPLLLPVSLRAAVEHPEVTILNCSLNKSHRYIRTYYARMYEVKFIIGAIAGALAREGKLGYLCNYPIYGQIAGINAFALGARMVNPRAKVYLEWSSVDGLEMATRRITDREIDLISLQDMIRVDVGGYSYGLAQMTQNGPVNLAMPVWRWGVYYETILRRIFDGSFRAEYEEEPFHGPIHTQNGWMVNGENGGSLTPEQIVNMDWLAENVVGSLPSYEQLTREGKAAVDMVGVDPSKDKAGAGESGPARTQEGNGG